MNQNEFPLTSLEPLLSEETMYFHYEKIFKNYWKNFLSLVKNQKTPLQAVLNIDEFPLKDRGKILHYAGGILNHELYFEALNLNSNHYPTGNLKTEIDKKYGSFDNFKIEFIKNSSYLVGSGYTFLVLNSKNELDIINTSNQETPYLYDMIPIMNIDLWEHAYYLDYQNEREKYVNAFFKMIDFDVVSKRYEQQTKTIKD